MWRSMEIEAIVKIDGKKGTSFWREFRKTCCFKSNASWKNFLSVSVRWFLNNQSPIAYWTKTNSFATLNASILIFEPGLACMASFVSGCLFVLANNSSTISNVGSYNGGSSLCSCSITSSNDFWSCSYLYQFAIVLFHFVSFSLNVSILQT
jgi:hypothetical protein